MILIVSCDRCSDCFVMFRLGIEYQARRYDDQYGGRGWRVNPMHLPPRTLAVPEKTFDKLVRMRSTKGSTSTLSKVPIVSSIAIRKLYSSASSRNLASGGDRNRGFEGNSHHNARIGVPASLEVCNSPTSSCTSCSSPTANKCAPGPHFSRTLRVSAYGNLEKVCTQHRSSARVTHPKETLFDPGKHFTSAK